MPDRLKSLSGRTYRNYIELMRDLHELGFDSEFDNSLIIRELSRCIDKIWEKAGAHSAVCLDVTISNDHKVSPIAVIRLTASSKESIFEEVSIMVRENGQLAVVYNPLDSDASQQTAFDWGELATVPMFVDGVVQERVESVFAMWHKAGISIPKYATDTTARIFQGLSAVDGKVRVTVTMSIRPDSNLNLKFKIGTEVLMETGIFFRK